MLFSSYVFLFAFLPLTLLGYFALARVKSPVPQRLFLIAASLVFYGWFSVKYLLLFASSIAANYVLARCGIAARTDAARRICFILAAAGNLLLLGYYKYLDFFLEGVNALTHAALPLRQIVLPLGISFFTFQQIAFQLRVRRGDVQRLPLAEYVLFVSFFPQLVAGPIVQYKEMSPQLTDARLRTPNAGNLAAGAYMFILGLFKKLAVADTLALWVDNAFALSEPKLLAAWFCMFAYAFQIFFDFSGYSDMAVGLGRMFNIELPINFHAPYRSESVREFWRRWHITLGRVFGELVYIPLGGNRRGKARTYLNLFVTFFLSGLWHGANWTFVLWGVLHGMARILEDILEKPLCKVPRVLRRAGTFLFAAGAFVLFRAENFSDAARIYAGIFRISDVGFSQLKNVIRDGILGLPTGACALLAFAAIAACFVLVFRAKPAPDRLRSFTSTPARAVFSALLLIVSLLCISRGEVFIYFNF